MVIPNKFNGFHSGVRRCFGGGGGGGGGGDAGGGGDSVYVPPTNTTNTTNTTPNNTTNPNANASFANFGNTSVYGGPGVSTTQGMATLGAAKSTPWGQAGGYYNDLLNQGFSSNQIRNSASSMYNAPSDANWGAMVQNAGMNSPTGRPMAGSDQFFQPVYNTSYQNYANPLTAFNTSTYGTTPARSNASQWWQNQGATDQQYMDRLRSQAPMAQNMNIGELAQGMQQFGISPSDMQAASSYGGSTYGGFNPSGYTPPMQTPFNPYTNSSGYGGGFGSMSGYGQQMQSPFSFQQPSYQPQMQTPFSYQQQSYQPSYQQPSYGGYSSYGGDFGGDVNMYTPVTQQPTQPVAPRSSGPTTPIVGRSSGFRGTPNVMRRAEGGIASLMDDVE
jgi:hypothetical protein